MTLTVLGLSPASSKIGRIAWQRSSGERTRRLDLYGWASNNLVETLQLFPSLKDLSLSLGRRRHSRIPVYDFAAPNLKLRTLMLVAERDASPGGSSIMILAACKKSLESLALAETDLSPDELFACLIESYPRLTNLTVFLNLAFQHAKLSSKFRANLQNPSGSSLPGSSLLSSGGGHSQHVRLGRRAVDASLPSGLRASR